MAGLEAYKQYRTIKLVYCVILSVIFMIWCVKDPESQSKKAYVHFFSCVHATLLAILSVRQLIGWSMRQ